MIVYNIIHFNYNIFFKLITLDFNWMNTINSIITFERLTVYLMTTN